MSEDPGNSAAEGRRREHARRNAMQHDLLRRAYQRSVHRTYIEAALRRTGHTALAREPVTLHSPSIRSLD